MMFYEEEKENVEHFMKHPEHWEYLNIDKEE